MSDAITEIDTLGANGPTWHTFAVHPDSFIGKEGVADQIAIQRGYAAYGNAAE